MSEFVKPVERDNWGTVQTFLGEPAKTADGTWAPDAGVPQLQEGKNRVRWPDGTEETVEVVMRAERGTVHDMGHSYDVVSTIPYVVVVHNGARLLVRATESGCTFARQRTQTE